MTMTLLLPWFPILLGAGIGGRLLGRRRGFALGLLCGLFWIVLAQAWAGRLIWLDPWTVATLISGAAAVCAIGGWAGETAEQERIGSKHEVESARVPASFAGEPDRAALGRITTAMVRFDDWLAEHRDDSNPWPAFDGFLRTVLFDCCGATHVKPYRLTGEDEALEPLLELDPFSEGKRLSVRKGITGHVVTTGRGYVAGDESHGELVDQLASESGDAVAWCFPVKYGSRRLGAVTVGQLDVRPEHHRELLRGTQRLVTQFWCLLTEACKSRAAKLDDPVSGLYMREAFLRVAEQSLSESYTQGEPVAVVVVAIEGLRKLNDTGRWGVADELIREVSGELKRKVRMDDRVGRFDGSRFVLLLRRVDSELASLIVTQLASRLARICEDRERWGESLPVRCGIVGSGVENPALRDLLTRALAQCNRARSDDVSLASDLASKPDALGTEAIGART